jgi:hypothetical protein
MLQLPLSCCYDIVNTSAQLPENAKQHDASQHASERGMVSSVTGGIDAEKITIAKPPFSARVVSSLLDRRRIEHGYQHSHRAIAKHLPVLVSSRKRGGFDFLDSPTHPFRLLAADACTIARIATERADSRVGTG